MQKQFTLIFIFLFCLKNSSAQFQAGFGISPSYTISIINDLKGSKKIYSNGALDPHVMLNYVHQKKYGAAIKLSWTTNNLIFSNSGTGTLNYVGTHYPKPELGFFLFYKKPVSKKINYKVFGGSALVIPIGILGDDSMLQNGFSNVLSHGIAYAVTGTGIVAKVPGRNHFLELSFDYHFGVVNKTSNSADTNRNSKSKEDQEIHSRLSYLEMNISFIFGNEKGNLKSKREKLREINYVM